MPERKPKQKWLKNTDRGSIFQTQPNTEPQQAHYGDSMPFESIIYFYKLLI